jgi:peptide chain release factor 1
MLDKLSNIEKKYLDLREQSMDPEIISDQKKSIAINKEISSMQDMYDLIQDYRKYEAQIQGAKEIINNENDAEMLEMAKEELKE